jgi:acetylornithine deacetylase
MQIAARRTQRLVEVLSALVGIDSINPMGWPYDRAEPVERRAIQYIEQLFAPHASRVSMTRQTCSPIHENLVIILPGDPARPAALFESHIDTVPADPWMDRALKPVVKDSTLYGLGSCDDKGCLAAMILALLEIAEEAILPPRTIILVCAGDEEYARAMWPMNPVTPYSVSRPAFTPWCNTKAPCAGTSPFTVGAPILPVRIWARTQSWG